LKLDCPLISNSVEQTLEYGRRFTNYLKPGDCVLLYGDIGAGKTVFVKGIARGLHVAENVTSPTFTIVHEYQGKLPLYHIDLYRIKPTDVFFLGIDEYLWGNGIAAVEWADRLEERNHPQMWKVTIAHKQGEKRIVTIQCQAGDKRKLHMKR